LIGKKVPIIEDHLYPMKIFKVEKAAKTLQGRSGGGQRSSADFKPSNSTPAASPRSFDKAKGGKKWYGKSNNY
jgi:hypothetical protein